MMQKTWMMQKLHQTFMTKKRYEDKQLVLATKAIVESQRVHCLRTSRETDFHDVTPIVGEQFKKAI